MSAKTMALTISVLQKALEAIVIIAEDGTTGAAPTCTSPALTAAQATALRSAISVRARDALVIGKRWRWGVDRYDKNKLDAK